MIIADPRVFGDRLLTVFRRHSDGRPPPGSTRPTFASMMPTHGAALSRSWQRDQRVLVYCPATRSLSQTRSAKPDRTRWRHEFTISNIYTQQHTSTSSLYIYCPSAIVTVWTYFYDVRKNRPPSKMVSILYFLLRSSSRCQFPSASIFLLRMSRSALASGHRQERDTCSMWFTTLCGL